LGADARKYIAIMKNIPQLARDGSCVSERAPLEPLLGQHLEGPLNCGLGVIGPAEGDFASRSAANISRVLPDC
jgi:hypothetical protein